MTKWQDVTFIYGEAYSDHTWSEKSVTMKLKYYEQFINSEWHVFKNQQSNSNIFTLFFIRTEYGEITDDGLEKVLIVNNDFDAILFCIDEYNDTYSQKTFFKKDEIIMNYSFREDGFFVIRTEYEEEDHYAVVAPDKVTEVEIPEEDIFNGKYEIWSLNDGGVSN